MYCWEQRFLKSEPPQPWESQNCCESFVLFHCFTSRYYCKNEATSEDHVVFNKYASLFICNIDSCCFFFLMFSCTFMLLCCWVRICQQLDEFVMCHEFVMCQWTDELIHWLPFPAYSLLVPIFFPPQSAIFFDFVIFESFYNCSNLKIAKLGMIIF